MNFESLLSGVVAAFLRPDKLELRSKDDDRDADLNPPETLGDRGDGEESFETVFLIVLPPVLSNEVEGNLLEEEEEEGEETDNDGLTDDLLADACLVTSESVDLLKLRSNGDAGVDFLVSETLDLFEGLVATEGKELLLSSGRDRRTVSAVFFPATADTLFCFAEEATVDFSANPPVLFRLTHGAELELCDDPVRVDFLTLELESKLPFGSTFFLTELVAAEAFEAAPGFATLTTFFSVSDELAETCFCGSWGFSFGSSPG